MYRFRGLVVLLVKISDSRLLHCRSSAFLGKMGGAPTFASAKVKNAFGRIGIFVIKIGATSIPLLNLFELNALIMWG